MVEQRIVERLFKKYRANRLSEEERRELETLLKDGRNREWWDAMAMHSLADDVPSEFLEDANVKDELDRNYAVISQRIAPKRLNWAIIRAAAAVLAVALGVGWYIWWDAPQPADMLTSEFGTDALPGGNRASLMLPDGITIPLSSHREGIVAGNTLHYDDGDAVVGSGSGAGSAIQFTDSLVLSTPAGGQYAVSFSDGSRAWLNAGSTLKYPMRFGHGRRSVVLSGEAYFEVAPGSEPFDVQTSAQTVTVLGTAFNIYAYPGEETTETTLVHGSVKVLNHGVGTEHLLAAGQQSRVTAQHTAVHEVAVSTYISWRQGMFLFNDTELVKALKQLGRWYDVEIIYQGNPPETSFFGEISREKSLSQVLRLLKRSGVNFRIEDTGHGKVLTVIQ